MKTARMVIIGWFLFCGVFVVLVCHQFATDVAHVQAQGPPASWADVSLAPGLTAVILRDNAPVADQLIVRTFFWQQIPGIEKPILRSVFDVIPALKNTAVAATGAPDPSKVQSVHVDAIRIADRMEWIPKPPEEPKK